MKYNESLQNKNQRSGTGWLMLIVAFVLLGIGLALSQKPLYGTFWLLGGIVGFIRLVMGAVGAFNSKPSLELSEEGYQESGWVGSTKDRNMNIKWDEVEKAYHPIGQNGVLWLKTSKVYSGRGLGLFEKPEEIWEYCKNKLAEKGIEIEDIENAELVKILAYKK